MKSKIILFSFAFGNFVFFFTSAQSHAACDYFRIGSSLPVRSNKNIFVESWKVSCKRALYFETTVSNTEVVDPLFAMVYIVKSAHYAQALRQHVIADEWAVKKYTRGQVEDLLDEAGYDTQPDEFMED